MSDDDVRRAAEREPMPYSEDELLVLRGVRAGSADRQSERDRWFATVESLRTALSRASESGGNPTAWGIENARGAMEPCHFYLSEADARYYISYLNEWGSIDKDRPYRIIPLYRGLTTCGKPLVPNA